MTKLYQKDPFFFALACICVYVCTFSASESVSARLGAPYLFTVPAGVVLCLVLGGWIRRQGLTKFLGLCRFRGTAGQYLWFLPLAVPAGCNLWHGVQWNFPPLDTFIYILSMLLAGFLEEVLFRGLLFTALRPRGLKRAALISSLTQLHSVPDCRRAVRHSHADLGETGGERHCLRMAAHSLCGHPVLRRGLYPSGGGPETDGAHGGFADPVYGVSVQHAVRLAAAGADAFSAGDGRLCTDVLCHPAGQSGGQ